MPFIDPKGFIYSKKYHDEQYEYRHVHLTPEAAELISTDHLMSEDEWRRLGVRQSAGWEHYMFHDPEKHILLFRRPLKRTQT
uniref:Cyclin-dependent kinases regulatory subunit n=1 Tax=Syphacia muris TaxID=451379 RepID=A0A0N5A7X5_9BILA